MAVVQLVLPADLSNRQRNLPSLAATAITPLPRKWTYCLTPPPSATIAEPYAAEPLLSISDCQITSPVFLLRATIAAFGPPGLQMSVSPSIRTDSAKAQLPALPPKSLRRLFLHCSLPAASRQTRSPSDPSA